MCSKIIQNAALRRYELKHVVRTHLGADDEAYKCGRGGCDPGFWLF